MVVLKIVKYDLIDAQIPLKLLKKLMNIMLSVACIGFLCPKKLARGCSFHVFHLAYVNRMTTV